MVHPVQRVVESLYAAGRCPRLHVNALIDGVVCPEQVRARWRERLILDLDMNYPLDLSYTEGGLSADLSFGGIVSRCTFPWEAIYVVADRATGRGIVLDQHIPETVKRARQMPTTAPLPEKADLRPVFANEDTTADGGKEAPRDTKVNDTPSGNDDEDTKSEEQAQVRRAAFKVIDGGG